MHVCMWFVYVCMYVCGLYMYSHSHTHHIPPPAHTQQSELERDLQKMVLKRCNKNCFISIYYLYMGFISIYYLYMGPGPGARRVCPAVARDHLQSRRVSSLRSSHSLPFFFQTDRQTDRQTHTYIIYYLFILFYFYLFSCSPALLQG